MNVAPSRKLEQRETLRWVWPLDVAQYDQRATLSKEERSAILVLLKGPRRKQFACEPWQTRLNRLLKPILDALKITGAAEPARSTVVMILLREMLRHDCSFWKWKQSHWDIFEKGARFIFSRDCGGITSAI
jgi:hypothetical protein